MKSYGIEIDFALFKMISYIIVFTKNLLSLKELFISLLFLSQPSNSKLSNWLISEAELNEGTLKSNTKLCLYSNFYFDF